MEQQGEFQRDLQCTGKGITGEETCIILLYWYALSRKEAMKGKNVGQGRGTAFLQKGKIKVQILYGERNRASRLMS